MPGVIFCEQRGMATEIGFLEVPALIRQGISLPLHRYSYGRRLLGLQSRACAPSLMREVVKLHPLFFVVVASERMRLPNQRRQIMLLIFSAFWLTFAALVKAAMVMVGAEFAALFFILIIVAVLGCTVTTMISDVRTHS